ncbi:MAG TPA: transcription antitermination factor NusB [Polyangiaceae bacterium]|nr:transcription antitermination factor NusB [Polyangiaceae bacterium]
MNDADESRKGAPRAGPMSARSLAARVLERVNRDAAYAAAALDAEIERHPSLDTRDVALATELVYGVLRTRSVLVRELTRYASRGLPDDPVVVTPLLLAAYQILLLDRVPGFAAVDAAVSALKGVRGPKVAGFANAVLRKLAQSGERLTKERAVLESVSPWLLSALTDAVGAEEASDLVGANSSPRDRASVRLVSGVAAPAFLFDAEPGRVSPIARLVPRGGDLRRREGYSDGVFVIQEEGAQVVALLCGAKPGEKVLDACAGRGQKTSLLRERVGADALLFATDLYAAKLDALRREFERLRLRPPETAAVDWTVGGGDVPGGFDRVLVDAPCTGTGTLRRRPEIGLRLEPGDPARLAHVAESILRHAAVHARPGGVVVFAVCSVLPEEGEAVVARVADVLEPAPFDVKEMAHLVPAGATSLHLLPLRDGTDGFFIACFRRRA